MSALSQQAKRLESWMRDAALPFWDLKLDKSPDAEAIRRLRVQARQVYVYALADRLGWYDSARRVAETTSQRPHSTSWWKKDTGLTGNKVSSTY